MAKVINVRQKRLEQLMQRRRAAGVSEKEDPQEPKKDSSGVNKNVFKNIRRDAVDKYNEGRSKDNKKRQNNTSKHSPSGKAVKSKTSASFKMAKKSASSGEKNPFKDIPDRTGIPIGHDWVEKSTPEGVHNNPYKDIKRNAYNRLVHYPSKPGSKEAKGTPGIYPSVNDVNPESIRKKG